MNWKALVGLWRSRLIYYWKPFNQRRLKRFYHSFIQSGDLCFDIGAHLGNRSKAWLALGARVIALEPQPICIQYLEKSFTNHRNFTLVKMAVGSSPGKMPMYLSHKTPTVSSMADESWRQELNSRSNIKVEWDEKIEVEITTLDLLIQQFGIPAFCKIDVEDFEEEVLKGLSSPIPMISFEFFNWTPERTKACLDLLSQLADYQFNWSIGETQRLALEDWAEANVVFNHIKTYKNNSNFSGDIYARLRTTS